uniref:Uncharacterized protein n=1 Tax=Tanacetum cinerariifolium TaxID=118510 RepID=A0A6L2MH70_TANCI|nr:hypothetical protein [Tanacetum cinerariifolium]
MVIVRIKRFHDDIRVTAAQYKDAKSLFAAIESRFGDKEATKKTQKTLLKKMYENFSATRTNLPSEWITHVVVWRNKPNLDTMSIDDLYNNFKIVEQEVKGTTSSNSSSQNMAFLSSPSTNSTNEVYNAYGVSTARTQTSTQVSTGSSQTSTANLSGAIIYVFLANQTNRSQLVHEDLEQIHEDNLEEMDLKWHLALLSMRAKRECKGHRNQDTRNKYQDSPRRTVHVEETPPKSMVAIDGVGFDWSYMTKDEFPTNMALIDFSKSKEFKQPEFESHGPKSCETGSKKSSEDIPNELKKYLDAPLVKDKLSDNKDCSTESPVVVEKKTNVPTIAKVEFVRPKQKVKPFRKTIRPRAVNTARPRAVNTARPNSAVVNAVKANQGNVWRPNEPNGALITLKRHTYIDGHPQPMQEDHRYVNSRCSRYMTRNMSYLSDFQEFNGGYVTLGEEQMVAELLVKELLQLNNVLFSDTGCFVLSPDFKLADESHVLLKVPRKNNMYSVDMKNIVPKESLTCLVAKATLDESMLWHMRLVVTDDYRRHTWLFFLPNKNETTSIVEKFITEIENLVDKKVKNRALVVKPHNKTLYELFRCITPALSFMRPFGCQVTILNTLDHLGKFDGKADEGYFVAYSMNSKAFRVYNIRNRRVEENLHIEFLENKPIVAGARREWLFNIDMLTKSMNYVPVITGTNSYDFAGTKDSISIRRPSMDTGSTQDYVVIPLWKDGSPLFDSSLKLSDDTGSLSSDDPKMPGLETIATYDDFEEVADFINLEFSIHVSPTPTTRTYKNHPLKQAMQEKLLMFKLQKVWILVDLPKGKKAIGIKWVFRNKKDERGIVIKNKARLVAQGHTQEEGIDYDEVFTPVARIKAIRLFLAYASFMRFMVYQMDAKSDFLYGRIEEEAYVCQPLEFEDPDHPGKVYKVVKALYGLHQALRAWLVKDKFQMSSMGELAFFLELQVKQKEDGTFISQYKYVIKILMKFNFSDVKSASTPVDMEKTLVKDEDDDDVDVHLYQSMIGSLLYLISSRLDIITKLMLLGKITTAIHVNAVEDMGEDSEIPTYSHHTPTVTQPSTSSQPQQKKKFKKSKKRITKVPQLSDSTHDVADEHVTTTSNDPLPSAEDRPKLTELMELCTQLQSRVLAIEPTKANQALEIGSLKRRVKKLEKKAGKKTDKLRRLYKIGSSTRVDSSEDADYELATRLQEEERGELTIEEKSRLFVELIDKRKKYFTRLRAEKIRKLVKGSEKAAEGSSKEQEVDYEVKMAYDLLRLIRRQISEGYVLKEVFG